MLTPFRLAALLAAATLPAAGQTEDIFEFTMAAEMLLGAVALILCLLAVWWVRERRINAQRTALRMVQTLADEIWLARKPTEIAKRVEALLPQILGASGVRLYLYNRAARALEQIPGRQAGEASAGDSASGPILGAAERVFRNSAFLAIPDVRRSPLFLDPKGQSLPRAVLFAPIQCRGEMAGLMEVYEERRTRLFTEDEQAAVQHLANQIAKAWRLLDQQAAQEQHLRSERLAAAGQLMASIANELSRPLHAISRLADGLLAGQPADPARRELERINAEAGVALETVTRLSCFARANSGAVAPVDVNSLIRDLLASRREEYRQAGIELRESLAHESMMATGSRGQLEQVFYSLLEQAEDSLRKGRGGFVSVSTSVAAKKVFVSFMFPSPPSAPPETPLPGADAAVVTVCQGVIESHGGELRLVRPDEQLLRFEVELPQTGIKDRTASKSAVSGHRHSASLTSLVVEPDGGTQRHLVAALGGKGLRAVPVLSGEEAEDIVERLHFDVVLCSSRLPGMPWPQVFEKLVPHVGAFVLLTDGFETAAPRIMNGSVSYALPKPVDDDELSKIVDNIEARLAPSPAASK